MAEQKIIGVSSSFYCASVGEALQATGRFDVRLDIPARNAIQLRERELAAALLNPVDFARDSSEYVLVPDAAIASAGPAGPVQLVFRAGARTISTLAVDVSSSAEIILARIILAEEFDSAPSIIPVADDLPAMLRKADAALISGMRPLDQIPAVLDSLNLIEAWYEMTDLPYVYGLWCGRENSLGQADVEAITAAHARLAEEQRVEHGTADVAEAAMFMFQINDDVELGLRQFLHYAYYHGVLPDIPEIRYYTFDRQDDESTPGITFN